MKRLQYYLSIAQLVHMLLLAIGAAFVAEIFGPRIDRTEFTVCSIGVVGVIIWLRYLYNKTNNGTSKKRNKK